MKYQKEFYFNQYVKKYYSKYILIFYSSKDNQIYIIINDWRLPRKSELTPEITKARIVHYTINNFQS